MTKLAEQIQSVGREIDLLLAGDKTRLAIEEISLAHEELEGALESLLENLNQRRSLQEGDDHFTFTDDEDAELAAWSAVITNYDLVVSAWEEDRAKVRQCDGFGELVEIVDSTARSIGRSNRKKWRSWLDALSRDFSVSEAELENVRHVPEYKGAIAKYSSDFTRFAELARQLPESAGETRRIRDLANRMSEIKASLDFSLPEFVLEFYRALDEDGSFPLDKVSDKLMQWLADNSALKSLGVVRRGSGGYW